MLQIKTELPLTHGINVSSDASGQLLASVVAKGTFVYMDDRPALRLASKQIDVRNIDEPFEHADVPANLVRYPADMVPCKVTTDVGVVGSAYSPARRRMRQTQVAVRVGSLAATRRVDVDANDGRLDPFTGFAFLASTHPRRTRHAGTYDPAWQAERCPLPPHDFDDRYFSNAPDGLSIAGFAEPGTLVVLENLSASGAARFALPPVAVVFDYRLGGTLVRREGHLWSVVCEPEHRRVQIVWGSTLAIGKQPSRLAWVSINTSGLEHTGAP
jgi:hypothetical protein